MRTLAKLALSRADLINSQHGNRGRQARNMLRLGQAHRTLGHYRRAAHYLAASLPIFGGLQSPRWEAQTRHTPVLTRAAAG